MRHDSDFPPATARGRESVTSLPRHRGFWVLAFFCLGFVAPVTVAPVSASASDVEESKPKIAATLPTVTAIAEEIGGSAFEYVSLAKPEEDPRLVTATPALMQEASDAQVLFEVGLGLDVWADEVADGSGNRQIYRNNPGRVLVSQGIPILGKHARATPAAGTPYADGYAFMWLDPMRAKFMATHIAGALSNVSRAEAPQIDARLRAFHRRIDEALFGAELVELVGAVKLERLAIRGTLWDFLEASPPDGPPDGPPGGKPRIEQLGGWLAQARALRGKQAVEYREGWVYLCRLFGIELIGDIEEKRGTTPSQSSQRILTERLRGKRVELLLVDRALDQTLPRNLAKEAGARLIALPSQAGGTAQTKDYIGFLDTVVAALTAPAPVQDAAPTKAPAPAQKPGSP